MLILHQRFPCIHVGSTDVCDREIVTQICYEDVIGPTLYVIVKICLFYTLFSKVFERLSFDMTNYYPATTNRRRPPSYIM
jgi:hypothetical protein